MGCGPSTPEAPVLGEPKIALAPYRKVAVNQELGQVDIAYRVFREELKDAKHGAVVWHPAYGDVSENVWAKGKVDMLDGYCVIVLDNLAHGTESSKPEDPKYYTSAALAKNIVAILDQENITTKAHFIGYSISGYVGSCLLGHCPERWASVSIGGWDPENVLPGFVSWMLAKGYSQPWMDKTRDGPALLQFAYAACNPVPNLEEVLGKCSTGADGYPGVLLFAGESDTVISSIRKCSQKYKFPLVLTPGNHEFVNIYGAGIKEIRDGLLEHIKAMGSRSMAGAGDKEDVEKPYFQAAAANYSQLESPLGELLAAMEKAGKTKEDTTLQDLEGALEFHAGGASSTRALLTKMEMKEGDSVLDIGCGLGGPAMLCAKEFGCKVTGIDLTEGFIAAAQEINTWPLIAAGVNFILGDVTAMRSIPSESIDKAFMIHVGMNLPPEVVEGMAKELSRVLKPGGTFGLFDPMKGEEGEIAFPIPFATTADDCFLATPEDYKEKLKDFELVIDEDSTQDIFAMNSTATSTAPLVTLASVMGPTWGERAKNLGMSLKSGAIQLRRLVVRKA